MKKGKVYIVGAGPMDEGLITVKGVEYLNMADVVLYDRLVNRRFLKYVRKDVEAIYVGKSRNKKVPQNKINHLLIKKALEGKTVVRLKGGDPFLLGRGPEEALALKQAGIRFEVVSGVSSAFAVPGYAGIPPTFRGISSAVTVVTGQEDPFKKQPSVKWNKIYNPDITIVILMGMANLSKIIDRLISLKAKRSVPIAVIQEGTTPYQKVVVGTLGNIIGKVEKENLSAPAVVIIGKVVSLYKELRNSKKRRAILNKNVLVVSTKNSFYRIDELLEEKRVRVFFWEGVTVKPYHKSKRLDMILENIGKYDWIIFTSVVGVSIFMDCLKIRNKDARSLGPVKVAAIGPKTAATLEEHFVIPDLVPREFSSSGLISSFSREKIIDRQILILRSNRGSSLLTEGLKKLGAKPTYLEIYRIKRKLIPVDLKNILSQKMDVIAFTSSENVHSFFSVVKKIGMMGVIKESKLVCLGKPTCATLKDYGFEGTIPRKFTFFHLAKKILDRLKDG